MDMQFQVGPEFLDSVFRHAPVVFYVAQVEGECPLTYVTPNIESMLGCAPDSLLAQPSFWRNHLHPEDLEHALETLRSLPPGTSTVQEFRYIDANGASRWLRNNFECIQPIEEASPRLRGFLQDISADKAREAELHRQLEFTQTLINALPHPVYFKDRQGIYRGCNRAFEQVLGLAPGALIGKTVFDIAPPDLARTYQEADHALFAHPGTQSYETHLRHHDGTIHDILSYKATFLGHDGEVAGIIGSVFDISDRKRIEEELRQSELRFKTIANYTYNWENWIDATGKLLWINPGVERISGYTPEECLAMSDYPISLVHPDDRAEVSKHYAESLSGAGYRPLECRILRKDGEIRWIQVYIQQVFDQQGKPLGHRASLTDITPMKQINVQLRESEERLRGITETVAEGIYMLDAEGALTFINREVERLLGWSAQELLGWQGHPQFHICQSRSGDDAKCSAEHCKILAMTRRLQTYASDDEIFIRKDGSRFSVAVRATPYLRYGAYAGAVVAFHDITEQKMMQNMLREAYQELQTINASLEQRVREQTAENLEKERMLILQSRSAAMGEMISNIAHQWRQPLSTLGLVVQNIHYDFRNNELDRDALEKYVETAQQCVKRMSQTIDDFRNFFRPEKEKTWFNLSHAVGESLKLLDASLQNSNIQISLSGDRQLQVYGHVNEFSQVILNVLANAKDALMSSRSLHRRIEIELNCTGDLAQVVIRDNAGGIPDHTLAKIFDPYFTTKACGTGIGLYMSKTIIEKHMGGRIFCRNSEDGAEFTIGLPLQASTAPLTE